MTEFIYVTFSEFPIEILYKNSVEKRAMTKIFACRILLTHKFIKARAHAIFLAFKNVTCAHLFQIALESM